MKSGVGALLLAGGESSRMGTDKALLPALPDGEGGAVPLWQVLAAELERVAAVRVLSLGVEQDLGSSAARPGWSTVRDAEPGLGPLVALGRALPRLVPCDAVVVCAVDVALADAAAVAVLLAALEESGRDVCLCDEPQRGLAAQLFVARREPLTRAVADTLASGRRSLRAAMARLDLERLPPDRLPEPEVLRPCNTPQEWERVRAQLAARARLAARAATR